jgi:hypothetical protein
LTTEFLQALRVIGMRGVLVGGWGKAATPPDAAAELMVVDEADYDWLLPRSACVIHHGGSGTVAAVLRAGVPSILRTYIGSQQRFAELLGQRGLCTGVLDQVRLSAADLAEEIARCVGDVTARQAAIRMGRAMAMEADGLVRAMDLIEAHARLLASLPSGDSVPFAFAESSSSQVAVAKPDLALAIVIDPPGAAERETTMLPDPPHQALQASQIAISDADVRVFYEANPELFARRRIYSLQRVSLPLNALNEAATLSALRCAHSVQAWSEWLENQGIPFRMENIRCAAEEVPADLLPRLAGMSIGQWFRVDEPQRATVLGLVAKEASARGIQQAAPDIVKYLQNVRLAQSQVPGAT